MQPRPTMFALVLAALVAATLPALAMHLVLKSISWGDDALRVTAYTYAIALGHMLVLGVPALWWLRAKEKFRLGWVALAGALVFALPVFVLVLPLAPWADADDTWGDAGAILLMFGGVGAVCGAVFYGVCRLLTKRAAATSA